MLAERAPGWTSDWEPDSEPDLELACRSASVVAAGVRRSVGGLDMDIVGPHDSDAGGGVVQQ